MDRTEITRLAKNPYSLGLIARYVSEQPPFSAFEFGPSILTLLSQIHNDTHLVATRNDGIVGYLGWLHTTEEIAEGWIAGTGKLVAVPGGMAIAVTIFVTDLPRDILPMIKAAKQAEPGRSVYWKRYFADGRPPSARKVEVRR